MSTLLRKTKIPLFCGCSKELYYYKMSFKIVEKEFVFNCHSVKCLKSPEVLCIRNRLATYFGRSLLKLQ